ncbi:hypothetical protein A1O3_00893 [Capronia epimyces CBS 606.96]|uniref:Aflatoxin biosynthesis ketoreductase nor-1 n=1 Tax=Capronia epimyces CBS 606.96 TaxID=1182542 RepID=W9YIL3_9EURO|nr:uncharacterized protein A1O3_00893 [Capronia epimyces CBS 606.96]EXJ92343.1 hypothetical protein A1O3_00893 [Capronia epimyces CBS 606.96]
MSTVVLITGANRGIGKGLLERYLQLPNHTVIAANRNPDHATSKELSKLPTAKGTTLIVVKIDARIWQDAFTAVETLQTDHNVKHIDIVIANAGVAYCYPTVAELKEADFAAHIEPNVYGVVSLYQAVRPLLQNSTKEPIFTTMGSTAGSLNTRLPFPNAAYGPSKAAAAWLIIQINAEEEWLHSFALVPGWVHTDLGDGGAVAFKVDQATVNNMMIEVGTSCDGMMEVLSDTSKAKHGGKLALYDGNTIPW